MKHTPGPWYKDGGAIYDANDNLVARRHSMLYKHDRYGKIRPVEADANCRLIAAAPTLLDAAKLVVANWESGDLAEAVRGLQAAISIAEA